MGAQVDERKCEKNKYKIFILFFKYRLDIISYDQADMWCRRLCCQVGKVNRKLETDGWELVSDAKEYLIRVKNTKKKIEMNFKIHE